MNSNFTRISFCIFYNCCEKTLSHSISDISKYYFKILFKFSSYFETIGGGNNSELSSYHWRENNWLKTTVWPLFGNFFEVPLIESCTDVESSALRYFSNRPKRVWQSIPISWKSCKYFPERRTIPLKAPS